MASSTKPGLVAQIAEDADSGSSLPLLEWALFEMWRCLHGRMITLSDYRRIGGVAGALTRHADEAYERLTDGLGIRSEPGPKRAPDSGANWFLPDTADSPVHGSLPSGSWQWQVSSLRRDFSPVCTDDLHGEVLEIAHESL